MKEEIRKLWVEALRSGDYKQTTGVLRKNVMNATCYCANGVLCDLYAKAKNATWKPREKQYEGHPIVEYYLDLPQTDYQELPPAVMEWAGLNTTNAKFVVENDLEGQPKRYENVEYLNDYEKTFPELAIIIEKAEFV